MKAEKIRDNIYWVGAIDWKMRDFHGYSTHKGSTYNAYLVLDEKVTLIDTVKDKMCAEMMQRISSVIDPSKIDVIISNHSEPDHSGSIEAVLKLAPNAQVYASAMGARALSGMYNTFPVKTVKAGDTLSTGKYTFSFTPIPMVHWPDSMVTYLAAERILFSNDAFGQHYASNSLYDTEADLCDVMFEAKKYYANIVQPYNSQVRLALNALSGLETEVIAPSHGIIWTKHIPEILALYNEWADGRTETRAVVIYDTMYGSTEKMAQTVMDAFIEAGIPTKLFGLQENTLADIITELLTAKYMAVGCPTIDNSILPTTAAFLSYFNMLNGVSHKAFSFGSYGWSGQSVQIIADSLRSNKVELASLPYKHAFAPKAEDLAKLSDAVKEFLSKQ